MAGHAALVDDHAVEDVGDLVAVADAFKPVPFADRFFHVLFAAEAELVFPGRIAAEPVDAAAGELLGHASGLEVRLFALAGLPVLDLDRHGRHLLAADQDEVAGAAFDHLTFDRFHPDAAGGAIFAHAVQENATIARRLGPGREGLLAPLELDNQMIVLVF